MIRRCTSIIHNLSLVTLFLLIPGVIGDRGFHSVGGIPIAAIFGIFVAIAILVLCCRFLCRPAGQRGRMIRQFEAPVTIVTQTGPPPTLANPSTPFQPLMYPPQGYSPVTSAYPTTTSSQMPYPQYPPPPMSSTTVPPVRPQYPYPSYPTSDSSNTTTVMATATPYPSYPPVPSAPPPSSPPQAALVDYDNIAPPAYSSLYPERVVSSTVTTNTTTTTTSSNQ